MYYSEEKVLSIKRALCLIAVVQCNCKKGNKNNALELKNKWKASVTLGEIKETVIGVSRDNKVTCNHAFI